MAEKKNQTQVATKTPHQLFTSHLTAFEKPILRLLDNTGMTSDRFITIVDNMVRKTPKLLEADRKTLFAAILTAAELGLEPNTTDGFCYILPYNSKQGMEAQFQLGYKGVIELMYRIPNVKEVRSERVFKNDDFEYEIFPVKKIVKHKPAKTNKGVLIGVYAVVIYDDNSINFEYIEKEDLDKIQKLSKGGSSAYSPYNNGTDVFNWMQRKVAIKQIVKTMQKQTMPDSVRSVIELDNAQESGARIITDEEGNRTTIFDNKSRASSEEDLASDLISDAEIVKEDGMKELEEAKHNEKSDKPNKQEPQTLFKEDDSIK